MKFTDSIVDNHGTNIHYIDSNIDHNHEIIQLFILNFLQHGLTISPHNHHGVENQYQKE